MTRLLACALVLGTASLAFADDQAKPFTSTEGILSSPLRPAFTVVAPAQGQTARTDRPHEVGLGGKAGGFTFGMGASARLWQSEKLGFQVDLSHYGVGQVGILQVAPSVLFVLGQPDLDKSTQIRPYAGGGLNFFHVSYGSFSGDTGIGGQGFVGAEVVFSGAPRFGVSGDLGYYSTGDFFGVSIGGFAMSVAGHYYIR